VTGRTISGFARHRGLAEEAGLSGSPPWAGASTGVIARSIIRRRHSR